MGSHIRCGLLTPSQPSLALGSLLSLDSGKPLRSPPFPYPQAACSPFIIRPWGQRQDACRL